MTTVVIPFLMSMLLGRTIDLTTYNIGGEIYDFIDYEETPLHVLNSTYTVLQKNVLPYSQMGLPADIVLKIKADVLHSGSGYLGLDGLLKKIYWKSNSVIIAVTSEVQTVKRELKKDAPLLDNWTTRIDSSQTHYMHALVYGGWSIILYRFKCENIRQENEVRKLLTSVMGVSGPMDEKAVDLWQKARAAMSQKEDLKYNVELLVYSSVSHSESGAISSPDSILKAVQKFPEDVGELGQPIYVELKPLHDLDQKFPVVRADNDQEEFLLKLDEMYDDVRSTKTSIVKWGEATSTDFTQEENGRILSLLSHVRRCVNLFQSIAIDESIYKPMNKTLFDSAYYLYRQGLNKSKCEDGSYRQLLLQLREDIDPVCEEDFNSKITGNLALSDNERIEAGEMGDGLEGCKSLCLQDPKCRSIRYSEKQPIAEEDPENYDKAMIRFKEKQCWIQFRSSHTARVVTEGFSQSNIYDRTCLKTEF